MRMICSGDTKLTRSYRFLKILNSLLLAGVVGALLVVQPPELLENLGVIWVTFKDATVSAFSSFEL